MPHRGDKRGRMEKRGKCGGDESTVKQRVQRGKTRLETAAIWRRERMYVWGRGDGDQEEDEEGVKIQLLSSSSVAVSTSQDFDDNATITAFWGENKNHSVLFCSRIQQHTAQQGEGKKFGETYFFKAHGTEFVYFACVLRTGDGSACIDMRPEPRCLFEHLWVLLVLGEEQMWKSTVSLCEKV